MKAGSFSYPIFSQNSFCKVQSTAAVRRTPSALCSRVISCLTESGISHNLRGKIKWRSENLLSYQRGKENTGHSGLVFRLYYNTCRQNSKKKGAEDRLLRALWSQIASQGHHAYIWPNQSQNAPRARKMEARNSHHNNNWIQSSQGK